MEEGNIVITVCVSFCFGWSKGNVADDVRMLQASQVNLGSSTSSIYVRWE